MGDTALVVGAVPVLGSPRLRARLGALERPYVVAADHGAAVALELGIEPDVVIGDFDSLEAPTQALLRQRARFETYPRDKDATDGQLAIERALEAGPRELWLVGFLGGPRLDHLLANVFLLANVPIPAVLLDDHNECLLLRPGTVQTWHPEPGELVSLVPMSSAVDGVRTAGLRWRLDGAHLARGETRGVSNEPTSGDASVSIERGLLLVLRHFPPT